MGFALPHSQYDITLSALEKKLLKEISKQQSDRIAQLIQLVETNSGSLNPAGVNQVGCQLQEWFQPISDSVERLSLEPWQRMNFDAEIKAQPLGDLWRFRCRPQAPQQLLFTGHLDTVFAQQHPFQKAQYLNPKQLNGPGTADMKGGLLVILSALETLELHPYSQQIGWTLLLNPDEEIGSPGSAPILQQEAGKHDLGLIYEPALPDGNLAGERKGSGNFTIAVHGRAAHAGREPEKGRNAIRLAAELTLALDKLNGKRDGLTLNVGLVQGGKTTNQVPELAVLKFNIRIKQKQDAEWCLQQLQQILDDFKQQDGFQLELNGQFGRLPKQFDGQHLALYQLVQQCSAYLDTPLTWHATGGCCDGNNLSAAGLANVDTLGVQGNFIHSDREYIDLDSLTTRAQLSALLLFQLSHYGIPQH